MRVDECEVWVACEGQRLLEYDPRPEGEDRKTFTCFIPSEAGKRFALGWQNNSGRDNLKFKVTLDGSPVGSKWYRPQETGSMTGMRISPTMRQLFQFSQLETTDTDDALHALANPDLGAIRVIVERVEPVPSEPYQKNYALKFHSTRPVHERSKKLGAHCITLGEAVEAPSAMSSRKLKVIEPEKGPVAKFLFRYRPLALLQAQEIAPPPVHSAGPSRRSPTAHDDQDNAARPAKRQRTGAASSDNDGGLDIKPDVAISDDEGELNMLKGQLSQIMDRINRMEQKKKQSKNVAPLKVKKEEPGTLSPRLGMGSGDVIDLTLSD